MFLGIKPEPVATSTIADIVPSSVPFFSWATWWNETTSPLTQANLETPEVSSAPIVRVYLRRQVSVKVKGVSAWKDLVIGEGILSPVEQPPAWSPSAPSITDSDETDYALDWEGYVSCAKDITVPSFVSGDLHVKVCSFAVHQSARLLTFRRIISSFICDLRI
jgi:hypothetical protein